MTFRPVLLLVALLLPAAALANERPSPYIGFALGKYDFEDPDGNTGQVTDIGLRGGYRFGKFFAVEVRAGRSAGGGSDTIFNGKINYGGLFGRFDLPYPDVNVYFLLGGSAVEFDLEDGRETGTGISGGVGVELFGARNTSVTLDYMLHARDTSDNGNRNHYDGFSLGLTHHFDWPSFR